MSLSKEIKIIRQRLFMTQTDFADALRVSYTTVNRWETGHTRPNFSAMKEIKQLCNENNIDYSQVEAAWLVYDPRVKE